MKLCDRCFYRDGSVVPTTDTVKFSSSSESFDLCHSCAEEVRFSITAPIKKKNARKRTSKTSKKAKD